MHEIWNVVEKQSMHPQLLASDHSQSQTAELDALFAAGVTHILTIFVEKRFFRGQGITGNLAYILRPRFRTISGPFFISLTFPSSFSSLAEQHNMWMDGTTRRSEN